MHADRESEQALRDRSQGHIAANHSMRTKQPLMNKHEVTLAERLELKAGDTHVRGRVVCKLVGAAGGDPFATLIIPCLPTTAAQPSFENISPKIGCHWKDEMTVPGMISLGADVDCPGFAQPTARLSFPTPSLCNAST